MTSDSFIRKAKEIVSDYVVNHLDYKDKTDPFDIYVVWSSYILGDQKALLKTTLSDGMYYEVTYNVRSSEIYLDVYKKVGSETIRTTEED